MDVEEIREYALGKKGAEEGFPFGPDALVFKVGKKMFALISLDRQTFSINLKTDPEKSEKLREEFPQITPGWHMNKTHWNTVICDGLSPKLVKELIDDSYHLVLQSLSMKVKKEIAEL